MKKAYAMVSRLLAFVICVFITFKKAEAADNEERRTRNRAATCVHEGFIYRQVKPLIHSGATQVWRCTKARCSARAHSPVGTDELTVLNTHNHRSSATTIELREAKENLKEQAKTDTRVETRNLVADIQGGLGNEAATRFKPATASRMVQRAREIPGRKGVDAKELEDVVIDADSAFAKDKNGGPFLRVDTRQTEPDEPVFFIFASDEGLARLTRFHHWASDGTFKVTPSKLFQLYTINVLVDKSSIPSAFVLMTDKSQNSYQRVLLSIFVELNVTAPDSVMLDFEIATRNAYKQVYGDDIEIRLCLFHLGQSIHRHIQRNGLIYVYDKSEEYRKIVRSLAALCLLPVEDVPYAFDLILEEYGNLDLTEYINEMEQRYQASQAALRSRGGASRARGGASRARGGASRARGGASQSSQGRSAAAAAQRRGLVVDPASVFTYYQTYYIGTEARAATFPPETWNHFETQLDGVLGKTNNAQEGFHRSLNTQFSGSHPVLSKVITILQMEDNIATQKLRPHLLDPTIPVQIHARKAAYIANDIALNTLVNDYNNLESASDEVILAHLFAVQYRIGKNNFNHWDDAEPSRPND